MSTPVPSRKKGIQAYPENPFWKDTTVKVGRKRITVTGGAYISEQGEEVRHGGIHVVKDVDESEFLKLYTKNVRAIFDLKPTSQRVLQYLMVELQKTPNADAVYLAWFEVQGYFSENDINVSRSAFQRSLKELISKGFIAESTRPGMFWFNPNLFFNGNRMAFVHEYRRKPAAPQPDGDTHLQIDAFSQQ